ncbi:MAG: bifunctional adenosylcobinamide kinase/adenosylcobinamide-phosphate guanylyltransferase [Gemmatimonadota bacterium]
MRIILVTGGARAGKSRWAEEEASRIAGDDVAYIATAEPRDDEMRARIAAHRASRPSTWATLEVPRLVPEAVDAAPGALVLLDCLTLWVSNLLLEHPEGVGSTGSRVDGIHARVEALLEAAHTRDGTLLIVTNEVGLGLVPDNPLGRAYRDVLGWANARVARDAERVVLMVAGISVAVK